MGNYALPEIGYLKDNAWVFTEKIDGTNIRIHWDGVKVTIGGRTKDAQIPTFLFDVLTQIFTIEKMSNVFEVNPITLYGEGYGPKIQKGGRYTDTPSFILFDALVGSWWLKRDALEGIAVNLGISIVPIVLTGTINQAIEYVQSNPKSTIALDKTYEMEGLVGVPSVQLFDRRGDRIITKIKAKDFK